MGGYLFALLLGLLGPLDAGGDVLNALCGFFRAVAVGFQPVNQPGGFYCGHTLFHALSTSYQVYLPLRAGVGRFRHVPQGLAGRPAVLAFPWPALIVAGFSRSVFLLCRDSIVEVLCCLE